MTTTPGIWLDDRTIGNGAQFSGMSLTQLTSGYMLLCSYDDNPATSPTIQFIDPVGNSPFGNLFDGFNLPIESEPAVTALPQDNVLFTFQSDDGAGGVDLKFSDFSFVPSVRAFNGRSDGTLLDDSAMRGHAESISDFQSIDDNRVVFSYAVDRPGGTHSVFIKKFNVDTGAISNPKLVYKLGAASGIQSLDVETAVLDGSGGVFVTAWTESYAGDDRIRFRLHDGAGNAIYTHTAAGHGEFSDLDLNRLADGGFVLTWTVTDVSTGDRAVQYRVFNADGSVRSGAARDPAAGAPGSQFSPGTVALADGGFMMSWCDDASGGPSYAVVERRMDANGNLIGDQQPVHDNVDVNHPETAMIQLADGRVAMVNQISTTSGNQIFQSVEMDIHDPRDGYGGVFDVDGISYQLGTAGDDVMTVDPIPDIYFDASAGNDDITDAAGSQVIRCGDGDDTLHVVSKVGADHDQYVGGAGIDTLDLSGVNQKGLEIQILGPDQTVTDIRHGETIHMSGFINVIGTRQDDRIFGANGSNIHGGDGNDTISVSSGVGIEIFGEGGDDLLIGGPGDEAFDGGAGFDTVDYSAAPGPVFVNLATFQNQAGYASGDTFFDIECVIGSSFADHLDGSNLADQFDGGDGNDLLHGQGGDDLLRGQGDDDQLFGEAGNDELRGDQGQDVLNGGDGHDVYYGGGDADTFKFSSASDTAKGAQRDIIMDFELGIDVIDLQGVFGPPGTTILFIGSNGFNNTAGELRAVVNTDGNTVISGDIDGDHSSDFQIELFGAFMLTGGDFIA